MQHRLTVLVVLVALTACSGSDEAAPVTTATSVVAVGSTGVTTVPWSATGAPGSLTASFTPTGDWAGERLEPATGPAPDVLACTWRWFGEYELELRRDGGAAAKMGLAVTALQGDVGQGIAAGELELSGSGTTSVLLSHPPPPEGDDITVFRGDWLVPRDAICLVSFFEEGDQRLPLLLDARAPVSNAGPDSLQALLADIETVEHPLLPIANLLYRVGDQPPFDRIHVAADLPVEWIRLELDGSCIELTLGYVVGSEVDGLAPQVNVVQRRGCRTRPMVPGEVVVPDSNWDITVYDATDSGTDIERFAGSLRRFTVDGVSPVTGPAEPTADEWFEAFYAAHPDVIELHRFAWRDGFVAVVERLDRPEPWRYEEPVLFTVTPAANGGFGATGCFEYTVGDGSGYAWFVAADPATRILLAVDGVSVDVPLVELDDGRTVGLVDTGDAAAQDVVTQVVDESGAAVPCTQ